MQIAPFQIERFFAKYEFNAPYLLCSSDCESFSVQDLLSFEPEATNAFHNLWLGYTESPGHPDLRAAITKLYQNMQPHNILVHTGAEEAIFGFMNVALQPGDHLIVHFPCYQSLIAVAEAMGCEVTKWHTSAAHNWELDLDFLADHIKPNTKAIIVNCPHNPTGYLMSEAKLRQIATIAAEHDLWLFSDEVYRFLEFDPQDRLPAACDIYDKAVSLGVMSKTFGLPGLRIGWIATRNHAIYEAMAAFKDYTTICNSAPSEFLATLALHHVDKLVERNRAIVLDNIALLNQFFAKHADKFSWQTPKAGSIAFPSLLLERPIEEFCHDLVKKQGVLLLPGNYFDYGHKHFRLGFGRKNLPTCLAQFDQYLLSL